MFGEFLALFFSIFFLGSPIGISTLVGHCSSVVISLYSLKNLSQNYLLWIIIFIVLLTSQEERFSLEYILLAMSFFYLGADKEWFNSSDKTNDKRKKILLLIFLFLAITNKLKIDFSERGSLLLWLPIYLALYYKKIDRENFLVYLISGLFLFFSNKFTTLLAFLICLRSKLLYLLSSLACIGYFLFKQDLGNFLTKSFEPRLYIWKSVWDGFLDRPLFGHGFGTFAIDFPLYRAHAKVLGGRISEQIVHGHSLFAHFAFELGLLGLFLLGILFYLVYINVPRAFLPLLIIGLFDSPLVTFNQYLLGGLILIPFTRNLGVTKRFFFNFSNNYLKSASFVIAIVVALCIFIPSLLGHYYYSKKDIDKAIKWDGRNSLYYFTRGANNINKDILSSEEDLLKAIKLSPSVAYFYGFLGAAQLANNKILEAKKSLELAMKLDGQDGYWCLLYSYANYKDKKIFEEYRKKAFKKNPEIKELLSNPNVTSAKYIGSGKGGDSRLATFYRTGDDIYFPLPIVD